MFIVNSIIYFLSIPDHFLVFVYSKIIYVGYLVSTTYHLARLSDYSINCLVLLYHFHFLISKAFSSTSFDPDYGSVLSD